MTAAESTNRAHVPQALAKEWGKTGTRSSLAGAILGKTISEI